ncbi:MAG: hypothetical protein P4L49_07490 [Desulfosporosinus sp.]|nr:hypothetical protein [Desulfosporosinus sp.]
MKKVILALIVLTSCLVLVGCSNTDLTAKEKSGNAVFVGNELLKRKVIIRNSICDPLPPEANIVRSLPDEVGPQQLPNVDLSTPIIITKMPYPEKPKITIIYSFKGSD